MRYVDETEEYVQFGSRRNTILLKKVVEIAARHQLHWKLRTELANGYSMELINYSAKLSHHVPPAALGKVLEKILTVLKEWTGEDYNFNRKCTYYGFDAHENVIQWLNGRDNKPGRWVPLGASWEDGPDMEIMVSDYAILESVDSGEIYLRRHSVLGEVLRVYHPLVDGETWEVPDGTLFYAHGPLVV